MKYRLSLDIGVGSIGPVVLSLDERNKVTDIIDKGVCIFEVSEGAEERRLKRTQRKTTQRTKQRLNLLSKTLADAGLWSLDDDIQADLINLSPYRIRAQGVNGKLNNLMELGRAILHMAKHRGASFVEMHKLEIELEKAAEDKEDGTKKKKKEPSEYARLVEYLKESGAKTIGEYFFMRLHKSYKTNNIDLDDKSRRYVRQRKGLSDKKAKVDYAIPRYLVKEEFNLLWDKQANYYKHLKDKELKKKIYDILFYESDHRPYATGNCIFIENEKRLAKAHPLSEKRRIYEAVNNIRIQELKEQRKLAKDKRDLIINELLLKGQKVGEKGQAIKKLLNLKNVNIILADSIKPYLYSMPEYKAIDFLRNLDDDKLAQIVEFMAEPIKPNKKDYLYNDEQLIEILKKDFGTDDEQQISQLLAMLPKGRGSLGKTATVKILELLEKDVISIREATDKLAKTDNRFIAEEERAKAIQGKYDELPYYGEILKTDTQPIADWQKQTNKSLNPLEAKYGKIANPAVHRILNQIRKVVNDIIRIYGKPYDINIELAREVGMSSKKKAEYEKKQKENRDKNEQAAQYLKEHKIRVTSDNILKCRLAEEQNWKDAFAPLERIHPRFEGFEIEHLIPDSLGGTDARSNRVLIKRSDNLNKGNMYPYDYLQNKHGDKVYGILKEIRANRNMPDGKKWRFESDAKEKFESGQDADNITRYLTDTRYVCKLAARYLKAIVDYKQGDENNTRVLAINGGHTAKLRGIWNLDGIEYDLMGLNEEVPEYLPEKTHFVNLDTGEVLYQEELDIDGNWKKCENRKNEHWQKKPRIDHRHHIVDAITIGCVSRADMQKINWHDKRGYEIPFMQLPVPLSDNGDTDRKKQLVVFRDKVIDLLRNVKVYHKPEHSKSGQLHEATGKYALMANPVDPHKIIVRYNRPVSKILERTANLKNLLIKTSTIKPQWHKDISEDAQEMIRLKAAIESRFDEAEKNLKQENQQLVKDGKKEVKISEAIILKRAFKMVRDCREYKLDTYPVYDNSESLIFVDKHKVAYKGGRNYRLDFYQDDKGKVGWELINRFDANRKDSVPQWKLGGFMPIWSLYKGDMIELKTPESWKRYTDTNRCLAVVEEFSAGKIGIKYHSDARQENRDEKENLHIKQDCISDKGLIFCTRSAFGKIELTPFCKVGRRHKKLWDGKKEATKQPK